MRRYSIALSEPTLATLYDVLKKLGADVQGMPVARCVRMILDGVARQAVLEGDSLEYNQEEAEKVLHAYETPAAGVVMKGKGLLVPDPTPAQPDGDFSSRQARMRELLRTKAVDIEAKLSEKGAKPFLRGAKTNTQEEQEREVKLSKNAPWENAELISADQLKSFATTFPSIAAIIEEDNWLHILAARHVLANISPNRLEENPSSLQRVCQFWQSWLDANPDYTRGED